MFVSEDASVSNPPASTSHANPPKRSVFSQSKKVAALKDKWTLLPAFLKAKGLVKQHIDSYNYFVQTEMRQIIRAQSNRMIKSDADPAFFIEFTDCRVGAPRVEESMVRTHALMTPMNCRIRDLTGVEIGRIPVMLRSCLCILQGKTDAQIQALGECVQDPGGYFVVKGTEKVVLMQEQLSKNRIITELDAKHCVCAQVTSATAESKSRTLVVHYNRRVYLRHNTFSKDIPICIALKAMGLESDQEIVQMVGTEAHHYEVMSLSIQELHSHNILTQNQALAWIGRQSKQRTFGPRTGFGFSSASRQQKDVTSQTKGEKGYVDEAVEALHRVVLSHIETSGNNFRGKSQYLCLMVRRVLDAVRDKGLLDDKDFYSNKRLELAGQLLGLMFEDLFKRFCSICKKQADQSISRYLQSKGSARAQSTAGAPVGVMNDYPDCFSPQHLPTDVITKGMNIAISTGNWNIRRFKMERSGVAQVLSRLSYIACLGMMTRINSQFEKARKVSGPRALQPSQWGMLCPCDTPEGESCGLVKNLALMTHVTTDEIQSPLVRLAFALGVEDATAITGEELHDRGTYLVFLNGTLLGVHRRPKTFMSNLRELRRHGKVGEFVSVYDNDAHKAIYIASDGGRLCRPLIVVENGRPRLQQFHLDCLKNGQMSFMDFMRNGILEWIDVNEENTLLIALKEDQITQATTHIEIDPLTLLGVVAGLIPYPHHNQSPRNTYQCAMGKQAMGAIAFNQMSRTDTLLYLLVYPQKPLVKSRTLDLIKFENLPAGQNASVAIMSYSGYDIEDALIMNRYSLDRGFGRCYVLRRITTEMKKHLNGTCDTLFRPPAPEMKSKGGTGRPVQARRFAPLDNGGLCNIGELVLEDQIYINRHTPTNTHGAVADASKIQARGYYASAVKYKNPVPSYVDRLILTEAADGSKMFKTIFRQVRRPELGDKFSSRHGQKGVVGLIVNQEDMPFAESGWCPDVIMNPHGFPSRMTVGKMIELIAGKSAVLDGVFKYGTAFGGTKVDEIGKILMANGYHYNGKEYLTSGITGEALETYIFVGPIFYQKLKHMVQDKIHARGRGPRQLLTRQPTEGRARDGGLRLGEMERDCLVAYGTSNLLLERLMLSSDAFDATVCTECGLLGHRGWCTFCQSDSTTCSIKMPYACKLLFQELQSMNVCPRLGVKEK
eukprot:GHVN01034482.1.p1 GENE.GHVN01034482.1~~GHVN01034482.1.p1  ORF type:complete len:1175 (+),score=167.39 GHVN01034482.1:2013-5537(+)